MDTYTIIPAPKHSAMYAHDCDICGREELTNPIWLKNGAGTVIAVGSGCAAKVLYGTAHKAAKVRTQADVIEWEARETERLRLERMEMYRQALEAFDAGWDHDPNVRGARTTFHVLKPEGFTFRQFVAYVADNGTHPIGG